MCVDTQKVLSEDTVLLSQVQVTDRLYLATFQAPQIAAAVRPGQFVHLQVPGMEGHMLRRPISVYQANPEQGTMVLLYQVVGFGSDALTKVGEGQVVNMLGPIGNGWVKPEDCQRALFVVGGVGAAPLFLFASELVSAGVELTVVMGAQTKDALACKDAYEALPNTTVICCTDDGSFGTPGFCTVPAAELMASESFDLVASCGPTPVMAYTAKAASEQGIPCQVSMEKHMACGIGACLGCIVATTEGNKRSCVDGPVFDARKVVW
ncbi:MAG: dihydroorotate dehydrogenase electron transfer subunit [Eggerthellales bacterium]|nr:dihydroorotate dehydrogenase electron transfer subunit [Eggerthellales bacterium]